MDMNAIERKKQAVKLMQQLGLDSEVIENFSVSNRKTLYATGCIPVQVVKEACNKIREIEEKYDVTVYAMLYNEFYFGNCFTYLVVPKYQEDLDMLIRPCWALNKSFLVYAYVWNVSKEWCSEFGSVQIKAENGELERTA